MIYESVVELLGQPPVGMESIVYALSMPILMLMIMCAFNVIGVIVKWIGGK